MEECADQSLMTIDPDAAERSQEASALTEIGRGYRLGSLIGRGGMGMVHSGEQSCFPRPVAIKSLLPERHGASDRSSFTCESVITALLDHPNIPPVHDLIEDDQGQPRLVMKIIKGHDWQQLLQTTATEEGASAAAGPDMDLDAHLEVLLKVCDAISCAHQQGIIHRDLKPANIMVGAFGEVTVMDWGCAGAYRSPAPHPLVPLLADRNGIAGTPAYMAPEMARGIGSDLGPHSDIYLLGACLYEVLTGSPPHRRPGSRSGAVLEVLARAEAGQVEAPSKRAPNRVIPPGLAAIAMRAMATAATDRFRTVTAFADALRDWRQIAQLDRVVATAHSTVTAAERGDRRALSDGLWEAIAGCEYVRSQAPQHEQALGVLIRALLLTARHAVSQESWALAERQMARVSSFTVDDAALRTHISTTSADIAAGIAQGQRRRRLVSIIGWASYSVACVLFLVLVISYHRMSQHRAGAAVALREAQQRHDEAVALSAEIALTSADHASLSEEMLTLTTAQQEELEAARTRLAALTEEHEALVETAQRLIDQQATLERDILQQITRQPEAMERIR